MKQLKKSKNQKKKIKSWLELGVGLLVFALLAIVLVVPGALRLVYRADAQVALGNAKSVRLALEVTGKECYGADKAFSDASHRGGVTDDVWKDVINLSKAPGGFWVLQVDEDGYTVRQFLYREDDFTVWYQADPKSYTVYRNDTMIESK